MQATYPKEGNKEDNPTYNHIKNEELSGYKLNEGGEPYMKILRRY